MTADGPNRPKTVSPDPSWRETQPGVWRNEKGHIMPGSAKIPGNGRPISLSRTIKGLFKHDDEIVQAYFRIARGEEKGYGARERMQAWQWLSDRAYGKAVDIQAIAHLDGNSEELEGLRTVAVNSLLELAQLVSGKPLPASATTITVPASSASDPTGTEQQPSQASSTKPESSQEDTSDGKG